MAFGGFANVSRVGVVSTRIAGTDGVSLETKKWVEVLQRMGLECWYVAGELEGPKERCIRIEEAHFAHEAVRDINRRAFGVEQRDLELTADIRRLVAVIRDRLHAAIDNAKLDLLIAENALTIPMNLPLGLALVQTIQETAIPCIAHHHDFHWERERFLVNAVDDILDAAFPPRLSHVQHVAINSLAAEEFSRRTGLSCRVIPNVMDFANPPPPLDEYAQQFRGTVGLKQDDVLILQPTRVVARKGIEHAIELTHLLGNPRATLVISHSVGDEGDGYARRVRRYAEMLDVRVIFAGQWIGQHRGTASDGRKRFTLQDVFPQADLVTYPSTYEGFGNAFLEAVYFKRPVLCNRYSIYRTDIEPSGFKTISFDGYLTDDVVGHARRVLEEHDYAETMATHNYEIGRRFFSYNVVEEELRSLLRRAETVCGCCTPTNRLHSGHGDGCQCPRCDS